MNKAARAIQFLDVSEANYRMVYKSRYEKIVNFLVYYSGEFLDLPPIKTRSSNALRKFIDDAKNHLRALEKLDEYDLWDIMILIILSRKLDLRNNHIRLLHAGCQQ